MRVLAVVAAVLLAAPGAGWAEGDVVVLRPVGAAKVKERHRKRAENSLVAAATTAGLRVAGADVLPADAFECPVDSACLGRLGRGQDAGFVVGALLEDLGRDRFRLTLVGVDVAAAAEVTRQVVELDKDELPSAPGAQLLALLPRLVSATPPVVASPPVAAPSPPAPSLPAPRPPAAEEATGAQAEPVQGGTEVTSTASRIDAPAGRAQGGPPRLLLGLAIGAAMPRGALDLGGRVAFGAGYRLGSSFLVGAGIDWTRLGHQGDALLTSPAYSPGMAEVTQTTDVIALAAVASVRAARWPWAELWAGAALGLAWNRSRFEMYSSARDAAAVAPHMGAKVALRSARRGLGWLVAVEWRESAHDLDAAGAAGEETTSALLVDAGLSFGR